MRQIVLTTVAAALIAVSASQALAAPSRHHVRKEAAASEQQFRNARNAIAQPSQPSWPYVGWSAPAGR
ncbi:hypothetical protein [Bradyrhizobium sp. 21]|uniref:hypothetical protein n=1 Tax=Bradyrhizobium sp. 21 TaxID=2782666 RepID=UPI001FF88B32|nr:hypothetical protein [Bradyrhizobium sp. 21]MCK1384587.1 hypothetical protein [Bradyrhizobium sp. 21]